MKEFLLKIKNKLKSSGSFKKINPHIYWNNLLRFFFSIMIILVIFSFYLLYKIKNQQIFQVVPLSTESPVLINEKLSSKVMESFNLKMLKQTKIKEGPDLYKDPSIN